MSYRDLMPQGMGIPGGCVGNTLSKVKGKGDGVKISARGDPMCAVIHSVGILEANWVRG